MKEAVKETKNKPKVYHVFVDRRKRKASLFFFLPMKDVSFKGGGERSIAKHGKREPTDYQVKVMNQADSPVEILNAPCVDWKCLTSLKTPNTFHPHETTPRLLEAITHPHQKNMQ